MIPIFDNEKLVFHCFITTINSLSLQFFYFNDILIIMKGWYMSDYLDYLNKIRKIKVYFLENIPTDISSCEYNHHLLLNRLSEARNTYLLLMDNHRYNDAMLIAGHILENCALIDYIQKDELNDKGRTKKYIRTDLVKTLCDLFDFAGDNCLDQETNYTINELMDMFKDGGDIILKTGTLSHEEIMQAVKNAKNNSEKKKILEDNYYMPTAEFYLKPFRQNIAKFYKNQDIVKKLLLFYASYCKIKHCGSCMYCPVLQPDNTYHMTGDHYREYSPIVVFMCLEYSYKQAEKTYLKLKKDRHNA